MTTATATRTTAEQLRRSSSAAATIGLVTPCTVVDTAWSKARRYEHVTAVLDLTEAAAADIVLAAGDAVAPVVLVIDRPGARTAFVAVDAATCTLELELGGLL